MQQPLTNRLNRTSTGSREKPSSSSVPVVSGPCMPSRASASMLSGLRPDTFRSFRANQHYRSPNDIRGQGGTCPSRRMLRIAARPARHSRARWNLPLQTDAPHCGKTRQTFAGKVELAPPDGCSVLRQDPPDIRGQGGTCPSRRMLRIAARPARHSRARWNLPLQTDAPHCGKTRQCLEGHAPACPLEAQSQTTSANR